jgi:SAM-dependent methyltransferase
MAKGNETSWGKVAGWYDDYLGQEDTYQAQVILPNLVRLLNLHKGERILDLACGQGFFTQELVKLGAQVVGADISPELIAHARARVAGASFYPAPAHKLGFAKAGEYDAVICVLALQNMSELLPVFKEARRVLKPRGRFVMVLNHPTFRVLKRSSWGWDEGQGIQYRRVDGYLSAAKIEVDMSPGSGRRGSTVSYHRSLQDFFKALSGAGLTVSRLEEWISHKQSGAGTRQKAEDLSRKEIPLFMALEARAGS